MGYEREWGRVGKMKAGDFARKGERPLRWDGMVSPPCLDGVDESSPEDAPEVRGQVVQFDR